MQVEPLKMENATGFHFVNNINILYVFALKTYIYMYSVYKCTV